MNFSFPPYVHGFMDQVVYLINWLEAYILLHTLGG